jgi:uncharacterized membrane protein
MLETIAQHSAPLAQQVRDLARREYNGMEINVGDTERLASLAGGGALVAYGLFRGGLSGVGLALLGGAILSRGVTGHCSLYKAVGTNTAAP